MMEIEEGRELSRHSQLQIIEHILQIGIQSFFSFHYKLWTFIPNSFFRRQQIFGYSMIYRQLGMKFVEILIPMRQGPTYFVDADFNFVQHDIFDIFNVVYGHRNVIFVITGVTRHFNARRVRLEAVINKLVT